MPDRYARQGPRLPHELAPHFMFLNMFKFLGGAPNKQKHEGYMFLNMFKFLGGAPQQKKKT
jgi:hypothetical protein